MFAKLKHFYYSYAINELPSDLWLAYRSKELGTFLTNGFNCTITMFEYGRPAFQKKNPNLFQ